MGLICLNNADARHVEPVFEEARQEIPFCDGVIIVMQKKEGGLLWFAPKEKTVAETMYLLDAAKFHLMKMMQG